MTYLREVPFMGVILVLDEAAKRGFTLGHPDWINLGQGQPEVGDLPGAPARIGSVDLLPSDHAYGPVSGTTELRAAVAAHYNRLYRRGRSSQYDAANVAITQGGRLALSRAVAALGDVNIGYMLPDYSAYEDMLGLHLSRVTPVPVRTSPKAGFRLDPAEFARVVDEAGLGAFLLSNPCNPTGAVLAGAELRDLLTRAREGGCALLLDEFYSHYHYGPEPGPVSAAAYVDNVDTEDVLIIDGLTKGFRYPGWRLGWVVGPRYAIEILDRVGSALDGGPSQLVQRAALAVLEPAYADAETGATRAEFARKRDLAVRELRAMGVRIDTEPQGTFYVWGSLADLPAPLNDATEFFRRALERQVITVPGYLFDVDPGQRRNGADWYRTWMRFSFGPGYDDVATGLDRLAELVRSYR